MLPSPLRLAAVASGSVAPGASVAAAIRVAVAVAAATAIVAVAVVRPSPALAAGDPMPRSGGESRSGIDGLRSGADGPRSGTARGAARPAAAAEADEARVRRAVALKRIARAMATGKVGDARGLMPLLKDPDAGVRREAELAIWTLWARSGNPEADRLLALGVDQFRSGDTAAALDTLNRVVDYAPRFAEAWNKRATVRYVTGDLLGALDDLDTALRLMPDHFGSLAGYGHIHYRLEDMEQAVAFWERALAINPNLERIERSIEAVRRLMAARGRVST